MNTNEIKEEILDIFRRTKCKAGHMVPLRTIQARFRTLPPNHLDYALHELKDAGVITFSNGALPAFYLTELGYDQIYIQHSDSQLMDMVLQLFRNTNCRAGQGYMFRTLQNAVINNLNPKDQQRIFVVLDSMIDRGIIVVEFQGSYPFFVKLTEQGERYL